MGIGRRRLSVLAIDGVSMKRTESELRAYAAFLLSEKLRHQDDIRMIDRKLSILAGKGIVAEKAGDWIPEEELLGFA